MGYYFKKSNKFVIIAKIENDKELFYTCSSPYWIDDINKADKSDPDDGEDVAYLYRKFNDLKLINRDSRIYLIEIESEIVYKRTGNIIE
jgi:hypothetical protein